MTQLDPAELPDRLRDQIFAWWRVPPARRHSLISYAYLPVADCDQVLHDPRQTGVPVVPFTVCALLDQGDVLVSSGRRQISFNGMASIDLQLNVATQQHYAQACIVELLVFQHELNFEEIQEVSRYLLYRLEQSHERLQRHIALHEGVVWQTIELARYRQLFGQDELSYHEWSLIAAEISTEYP